MSILDPLVIDFVGDDRGSDRVTLSVSDHLSWDDLSAHQDQIERKLNHYIQFVESGQLIEERPSARGKPVSFALMLKFPPPPEAGPFFAYLKETLRKSGIDFGYAVVDS